MNTQKIAALYPYFLDALRRLHTGRSLNDMMATVQLALLLKANTGPRLWVTLRDLDNPVQRFDELGMPSENELKELVPARVFEWVCQQRPTQPTYSDDLAGMLAEYHASYGNGTGWQVVANEVMPTLTGLPGSLVLIGRDKKRYATWTGEAHELAGLLRGLYAFRTKRRKHTRRIIAQLWAYHLQQQMPAATVPVVAAVCAPPATGLSPRLVGRLRRGLAAKVPQVAVAAEATMAEGRAVA